MNYIDITIIALVLFFVVKGIIKGFAKEIIGILSFGISFVIALNQMKTAGNILNLYINNYSISLIVGYIAVFLFVFIVLHIIAGAIHRLLNISALGWLNRLGGAVFGLFFSTMLISMTIFLFSFIPMKGEMPPGRSGSQFYPFFEQLAPKFYNFYLKIFPGAGSMYEEITNKVLSEELVKSGIKMDDVKKFFGEKLPAGGNILESLKDIGNIDLQKLKEANAPQTGAYEELFKHLNIDSTNKKSMEEMMKQFKKDQKIK